MNKLLKASTIAALILLIGGNSEQIYAQRCGGWVRYIVRDENGQLTDPETTGLKFVRINESTEYGIRNSIAGVESLKAVGFQTLCGQRLVEVRFENESRVMFLRFHNLPAETNFFVDSLPFQEGTFDIDFKGDMRLAGQELNREGLRDKDGKLLLHGTAQAGYLVSANNWKRARPQH